MQNSVLTVAVRPFSSSLSHPRTTHPKKCIHSAVWKQITSIAVSLSSSPKLDTIMINHSNVACFYFIPLKEALIAVLPEVVQVLTGTNSHYREALCLGVSLV